MPSSTAGGSCRNWRFERRAILEQSNFDLVMSPAPASRPSSRTARRCPRSRGTRWCAPSRSTSSATPSGSTDRGRAGGGGPSDTRHNCHRRFHRHCRHSRSQGRGMPATAAAESVLAARYRCETAAKFSRNEAPLSSAGTATVRVRCTATVQLRRDTKCSFQSPGCSLDCRSGQRGWQRQRSRSGGLSTWRRTGNDRREDRRAPALLCHR